MDLGCMSFQNEYLLFILWSPPSLSGGHMILKISHYYCCYSPSLHMNAGLLDSSAKYQLGSARDHCSTWSPSHIMWSWKFPHASLKTLYLPVLLSLAFLRYCYCGNCIQALFYVKLMNNIWLKVKRYILKVYNNKLLEHSQYSLQFFSAAVNIFFFYVVTQRILI